jgi:hypothetical protein
MNKQDMKPCPYCKGNELVNTGVTVRCEFCLMEGPKSNGGRNDEHADWVDREKATEYWNKLPR